MRTLLLLCGGILLGWQFGEWLVSGTWNNLPVSAVIPDNAQVRQWLYELNPSLNWWEFLNVLFGMPLLLVMAPMTAVSWLARRAARVRPNPDTFIVIAAGQGRP